MAVIDFDPVHDGGDVSLTERVVAARKLVTLTRRGREAYEAADRLQRPWANALSKGLDAGKIAATTHILETLRKRLEEEASRETARTDAFALHL